MTEITAAEIAADRASCEFAVVTGDMYHRLNPDSPMRQNTTRSWIVGPAMSRREAEAFAVAMERLQAELASVTAERDAARRALEALSECPFSCQWVLCTECEAALIAALPEKP